MDARQIPFTFNLAEQKARALAEKNALDALVKEINITDETGLPILRHDIQKIYALFALVHNAIEKFQAKINDPKWINFRYEPSFFTWKADGKFDEIRNQIKIAKKRCILKDINKTLTDFEEKMNLLRAYIPASFTGQFNLIQLSMKSTLNVAYDKYRELYTQYANAMDTKYAVGLAAAKAEVEENKKSSSCFLWKK